ncbi:hypothetical protein GGI18_004248 [Coemansia linderi]|uniref:Uncharacterized protein n=1 Tax=Coemansia linderi TaxID=2663919 RepID=A0ACC1K9R4_9FUNG|nr:hypothetical protein GGI18_004248 [Coemansia linderi]
MALSLPLQDNMFPRVRLLDCTLFLFTPHPVANICAFVEHIKRIAPMVSKVSVHSDENHEMRQCNNEAFFDGTDISSEDECFDVLASRLYQLANRISYTSEESFAPMELQLDLIHNLVSLDYVSEMDAFSNIVLVAQQSAQTLQKLTLVYLQQIDIADLVRSSFGGYVEYPCLKTLRLDLQRLRSSAPLTVNNGAVLFPSLRSLTLSNDYPFEDDVLLRGNAAKLEYLYVMPGRDFCDIVRKYKVFTPTSHPKLLWVESLRHLDYKESEFGSTEAHMQFVLSIAPKAAVRVIQAIPAGEATFMALEILKDHSPIQVLHLTDTQLMLWEVIHIVKWLPGLSDLASKSTGLGTYSDDLSLEALPEYVRGIKVPSREQFRCWRIGDVNGDTLKEAVVCILVVAMTFPNFSYAGLPNSILHEYIKLMEETLELGAYVDVAPRLRRLLPDKTV